MEDDIVDTMYLPGYRLKDLEFEFCEGQEMFFFSKPPRLALGSTVPPVHFVPVSPPPRGGLNCCGVKLTSDLHRVRRLRVSGYIPVAPTRLHGVDSDSLTFPVGSTQSSRAFSSARRRDAPPLTTSLDVTFLVQHASQ
jgi:hypothetical protein